MSVIIAGNIMNVLSAIVAEIMQILQNQIKQNVRTDSANESIHCIKLTFPGEPGKGKYESKSKMSILWA